MKKSKHRERFFGEHPRCCYCAGARPAVEIDHAPARTCFRRKEGPEGYEFPACSICNRSIAPSEQIAALYIRMFDHNDDNLDGDDLVRLVLGVGNNTPATLPVIPPTRLTPFGNTVVDLEAQLPPAAKPHIELFATKMLYAFYYRISGSIAGPYQSRLINWAQTGTEAANLLRQHAEQWFDQEEIGSRRNVDIGDQFRCRYGYNVAHGFLGLAMDFGQSFYFFCILGPAQHLERARLVQRPVRYRPISQLAERVRLRLPITK